MTRRTKILATLGPATDKERVLKKMLAAGVDVVRLNYSHGTGVKLIKRLAVAMGSLLALAFAGGAHVRW